MRRLGTIILLLTSVFSVVGQTEPTPSPSETPEVTDREILDRARKLKDPGRRVVALEKFAAEYPDSEYRAEAAEFLTSSRAAVADKMLEDGKTEDGISLFRKAVEEAPQPVPAALFQKVLVNIPTNLYLRGQPKAALDIADKLEEMSSESAPRLIRVAAFHIAIKYATGARRLAEKAVALDPESAPAHKVLADAARLGFDLQTAADSYERALEIDKENLLLKQSLAEMRRALRQPDAALLLYREILAEDESSTPARTGEILSLLDLGEKEDGRKKLIDELAKNPSNAFAMIGAANWFVANGEPDLAIDFANQAMILDDKLIWPYIIQGRAHVLKGDPEEAEKLLVRAASYSVLPTLSLELALTYIKKGAYRSAVAVARSAFTIEDGKVVTNLDRRVGVEAESFEKAVVLERKSFLFSDDSGITAEEDKSLLDLLLFDTLLRDKESSGEQIKAAADAFVGNEDEMRGFRRLYVSDVLLEMGREPELAEAVAAKAVEDAKSSITTKNAISAVMSDALFARRLEAAKTGAVVITPTVEKNVVERIYRGKIEMLSGRAAFNQRDFETAELRLKRAVSVLPKDSVWWKSGKWLLGQTKEMQSDDKAALNHFADSYRSGFRPTEVKEYIEAVYVRVNGSKEGIDAFLEKPVGSRDDPANSLLRRPEKKLVSAQTERTSDDDPVSVADAIPKEAAIKEVKSAKGDESSGGPKVLKEDLILDFTKLPGTPRLKPQNDVPDNSQKEKPSDNEKKESKEIADGKKVPAIDSKSSEEKKTESKSNAVDETPSSEKEDGKTDDSSKDKSDSETSKKPEITKDSTKEAPETKKNKDADVAVEISRKILTGEERLRVVPKERLASDEGDSDQCRFVFSEDTVSVFVNGGSFGIFVGLENYQEAYVLRARSLSPENLKVSHEPDIGSLEKNAFFVLTSVSDQKGEYKVEFESPCGKQTVTVSVY